MAGPLQLLVNHVERTGDHGMEWGFSCEEVLGTNGQATIIMQDRTNTLNPQPHWDVKLVIRSGRWAGWVLFRGEIVSVNLGISVGREWPVYKLSCSDYNNQLRQRLVGALDGKKWQDIDGLGDYINIDPYAHSLKTDRQTVQRLLAHYIRLDGQALNTTDYVGEYLTDFPTISWLNSDLQRALEELAGEVVENLQFWIDPDMKFHWSTIPAWQDVLQSTVIPGASSSQSAGMFPEAAAELVSAPYYITDVRSTSPNQLGAHEIGYDLDGDTMPQQIYVQGSTGYVYNAPPINPAGSTNVIDPTGYGTHTTEVLKLTFLSTTTIWARGADGLISGSAGTGSGGPYDVSFVRIPFNPDNGYGGHFWKLLTGPDAGKYVDNDTNIFHYGLIKIERIVTTLTDPQVGVGGSGFVGEVTQDPNKRQAYLDAPVSSSQAKRDKIGGQVLYRAKFPTLRGSLKINGKELTGGSRVSADGFRVGSVIRITDKQLPDTMNGRYFVIQRIRTRALGEFTDVREYTMDWGDGATSRYTYQLHGGDVRWPPPAIQIDIRVFDHAPGPSTKQTIFGQLMNKSGGPWRIAGKVVKWTLEAYTSAGALVTGQGELDPAASATDTNGRARTTFTTGTQTGLVYFIFADVPVDD